MADPQTPRLSRTAPERLSTVDLIDRLRDRAQRIDALGSSHSNVARALAKDALALADRMEREVWRFPEPVRVAVAESRPPAEWQTCPKCGGQGHVSKPPYIAGDQHSWVASNTGGFECPVCRGFKMVRRG